MVTAGRAVVGGGNILVCKYFTAHNVEAANHAVRHGRTIHHLASFGDGAFVRTDRYTHHGSSLARLPATRQPRYLFTQQTLFATQSFQPG